MRKNGIRGCMRGRKRRNTTRQDPLATPAPDLVQRNFAAMAPDLLWTADITYLHTDEGFLYLAFILDVYSRKVVGWSMASHLRSELVAAALQMAIRRRNPSTGLIHHSDRGSQYTALSVSTLKSEIGVSHHPSRQAAKASVFEFIEHFYNRVRRHSSLGYLSPSEYEQAILEEAAVA
jgi:putative transposase